MKPCAFSVWCSGMFVDCPSGSRSAAADLPAAAMDFNRCLVRIAESAAFFRRRLIAYLLEPLQRKFFSAAAFYDARNR